MNKIYILLLSVLTALSITAQDIHYTQFYNAPLITNPALTGLTKGAYRVGLNYRNQWFGGVNNGFFNSPYQTPSVFIDAPIRIKNDALGLGAVFLYDKAGAGSLTTFQAQASISYIKSLGRNGSHQLSGGFQAGYSQTRFDNANAKFASQYSGNEFNSNLNSGITALPNVGYVNLNAGLLYYGKISKSSKMYIGGMLSNVVPQKSNITTDQTKKNLPMKWNVSAGFDIGLGQRYHLLPSAMFMKQNTADQLNIGIGLGYDFSPSSSITLGVYDRVNNLGNLGKYNSQIWSDAIIAYAGFEVSGFKLGASYDFTTSKWKDSKPAVGALEISMIYIGKKSAPQDQTNVMFCPRF